ncbi:NAD-dependent succinate-semialdehyde dehydrogenase [Pigmentiphaga sp. H8]|uniref:NAD-dependent succinate-semialdehyde dehydrogenase n=1 Tax=Pigmentiphaga sp. H8 TaxID=2488560 RepID=UPI000F5B5569|nr:NAD-dependent succinate-semialdehyde dehydrogenase [Pigmentiphaga sp. H8]AZG08221.1 NAD-dependent succinate-semialdehyde dehydrogenase [Pigmentiphaga sp. H8]
MSDFSYPSTRLFIDGQWLPSADGESIRVVNPATGEAIGTVAHATGEDLERALAAADRGFKAWRNVSAFDRYKVLRKAADLLRERAEGIARLMTLEQGKPVAEAMQEIRASADTIDWFAEEGRRTYGRLIPPRAAGVRQQVVREPVGPVAAFTPWNFPVLQLVRKVSAALACGCSVIAKAPEETPASPAELIRAFHDAGVPDGVLNLVFGDPAEISSHLIRHPVIRKISFTGSTVVGKQLAGLAGEHMKRVSMELGGHAPVIVFDDADIEGAARLLAASKFRNAGQVCVSPTRFLVQEGAFDRFCQAFVEAAGAVRLGDGLDASTTMGPLANTRRVTAVEAGVRDLTERGATLLAGGGRPNRIGNFFEPTVIAHAPRSSVFMNDEPFGPVAMVNAFDRFDDAVEEANRLPYGLASYVFTGSGRTADACARELNVGMMSINHLGLAMPEVPFGGVGDSGHGSEGGSEAMESYLNTKFVTHLV